MSAPAPLTPHDVRRLAVAASLCPPTVERAYSGHAIRGTTSQRLAAAAHSLGILPPPGVTLTMKGTPAPIEPIAMILICPSCKGQHIDKGKFRRKPHTRHLCEHCGVEWTPARVPTVGVERLP